MNGAINYVKDHQTLIAELDEAVRVLLVKLLFGHECLDLLCCLREDGLRVNNKLVLMVRRALHFYQLDHLLFTQKHNRRLKLLFKLCCKFDRKF